MQLNALASSFGRFVSELRTRRRGGGLEAPRAREPGPSVLDPTEDETFATVVRKDLSGGAVWSDLSYSELDDARPEPQRRVVVAVMKALEDKGGRFAGVARVGLRAEKVEALVREVEEQARTQANLRLFICDADARLPLLVE